MDSAVCVMHTETSLRILPRRRSREVSVGGIAMGGSRPIRLQSMTTTDTLDVPKSIAQIHSLAAAGSEYVRLTVPNKKSVEALKQIQHALRKEHKSDIPLIADVHFTPTVAEECARIVEKVRINPGNYADSKRFATPQYTDEAYARELARIRERFLPLVRTAKEYGTTLRIGVNHGSLSDRIMGRYGDTPKGMVESALEFVRICEDEGFYSIVLSMKASQVRVMVTAYRLLVQSLDNEGLRPYPLHLGVTEAGDGADARIKSAAGIGTLLAEGLGDTIRVSLTEAPEREIVVARALAERVQNKPLQQAPLIANKKPTQERLKPVQRLCFGGQMAPRVLLQGSAQPLNDPQALVPMGYRYRAAIDKWEHNDQAIDVLYTDAQPIGFELPKGLLHIQAYSYWKTHPHPGAYPLLQADALATWTPKENELFFVSLAHTDIASALPQLKKRASRLIVWLQSPSKVAVHVLEADLDRLQSHLPQTPICVTRAYDDLDKDSLRLHAATDLAALLLDRPCQGIGIEWNNPQISAQERYEVARKTAFGILQACRLRMSQTEYIACPSCGRTLFDLEATTARIRAKTSHLKGLKIGIMGCIVNGPGEMADADYGYVGSGKGKITLYRGKEVVARGIPTQKAVEALIELIRQDGKWQEPLVPK